MKAIVKKKKQKDVVCQPGENWVGIIGREKAF
jgi:hypothetical protein